MACTALSLGSSLCRQRTNSESRPCFFFLPAALFIAPWRGALWSAKSHRSSLVHHASIPFSIRKIWWPGSSGWSLGKCEMLLGAKLLGEEGKTLRQWPGPQFWPRILKITPEQTTTITQTPQSGPQLGPRTRRSHTALIVYARITRIDVVWC